MGSSRTCASQHSHCLDNYSDKKLCLINDNFVNIPSMKNQWSKIHMIEILVITHDRLKNIGHYSLSISNT